MKKLLLAFALLLPAAFAQTVPIAAGRTSIALNTDTLALLSAIKVQLTASGLGRLNGTTLSFPITAGAADAATLKAEIQHAGGLTIQFGTTSFQLVNFVVDTTGAKPELTAVAIAGTTLLGRIIIFDLGLPASVTPPITPAGNALIDIAQVAVTLSADGSAALNKAFGTTVFFPGVAVGTARVQALVDPDAIP